MFAFEQKIFEVDFLNCRPYFLLQEQRHIESKRVREIGSERYSKKQSEKGSEEREKITIKIIFVFEIA